MITVIHYRSSITLDVYKVELVEDNLRCAGSTIFKHNKILFCICKNKLNRKQFNRKINNTLKSLPLFRNQIAESYLISLIFLYCFGEAQNSCKTIKLKSKDPILLYFICKTIFLRLENRFDLEIDSKRPPKKISDLTNKYEMLLDYLYNFVENSNNLDIKKKLYPSYELIKIKEKIFNGDDLVTLIIPSLMRNEQQIVDLLYSIINTKFKFSLVMFVKPTDLVVPKKIINLLGKFNTFMLLEGSELGVSYARQSALNKVTTQYVVFVDDDDLVYPDHFYLLHKALSKNVNLAAVGGWIKSFHLRNEVIPQFDNLPLIGTVNCLPPAGILMWNTSAIKEIGFDEIFNKGSEDFFATAMASHIGHQIAVVDQTTYMYRLYKSSTSSSLGYNADIENRINILKKLDLKKQIDYKQVVNLFLDLKAIHSSPFYWEKTTKKIVLLENALILYGKLPLSIRQQISVLMRK